jgi:two-component system sensor histidine kinase/response regulator
VYVDPRAPATLFGDAGRIRQVLTNLVGNAVKFTHAGSVTLSAEIVGATKDWCEVRFRVADTGIGISAEQLAHIFEPFAQADTSTTRLYGGSGLGLSICQQLVELMGGKLRADSIQASGSTFSFSLRLRAGAASAPVARRELNVLIVEGASTTASELTRYLRAWGICPTIANSREAALTACASAHGAGLAFDLAIVDADGLNGDAFAIGESLATQARSAPIRRMGVASRDVGAGRNGTPLAGFDVFLLRPLRQSQLFDCLMNVTPGAPATRAETPSESSGRRILLAEDNAVNQRVALKQLDKLGYDVTVVETGRAALGAVINERYDAVLMDCFMPEMDGYAATAAIRRHQSHTGEHTPIIAMTANAQAGDREMCIAAGMDDYLAKPVVLAALRDVLERYCHPDDRARAQRSTPLTQTAAPASV